jgi:hypothetical protein
MSHKYLLPLGACLAVAASALIPATAHAIPQFARKYNLQCTACHTLPPMLNERGMDFWQRGLRPKPDSDLKVNPTAPFAAWMTARQEDQLDRDFGEGYIPRVELISGGPIPGPTWIEDNFSYFLEWRAISLESRSDGTLRDRSGRFEDAYILCNLTDRLQITAGQFRGLSQVDVSRRLTVSEPAVFSTSLPGDPVPGDARVTSLRAFSPSGRQPGLMLQYRAIEGDSDADGLFVSAVLPFVGEWSLPMTPEAHEEASFVSQGPPKGAFLETYYRLDLNSIGAHAFIDNDRWLFTIVGTLNCGGVSFLEDVYLTSAVGWDDSERTTERTRSSVEVVYIPTFCADSDGPRAGVGFRAERVTGPGMFPAYIPFFVLTAPNESYTFLLQTEYRHQENNRSFFLDLSVIF